MELARAGATVYATGRSTRSARSEYNGLHLLHLAVDTHLITSHYALPLLIRHPGGLVVEMTDGTADYNATTYRVSAFYDLAKTAVLRLAWSQGHELAGFGCLAGESRYQLSAIVRTAYWR